MAIPLFVVAACTMAKVAGFDPSLSAAARRVKRMTWRLHLGARMWKLARHP
jgi:hypothetical protein